MMISWPAERRGTYRSVPPCSSRSTRQLRPFARCKAAHLNPEELDPRQQDAVVLPIRLLAVSPDQRAKVVVRHPLLILS